MSTPKQQKKSHHSALQQSSTEELESLRSVLFGKDYAELIALKERVKDRNQYSQSIATVVSEALAIRSSQDDSIVEALAPTIQSALTKSIENDPKPIADALYPVMGPAIRKSISEALSQMLETFNQLMEQSLSLKSILWRFEAWRTGRSYSEIILLKSLVFQVEQVFLINREDGLLLQHSAIENIITQDGDMVSGMLTAIQDFINDSFSVGGSNSTGLDSLRLGDLTVFIEHGPNATLAAVIRGKAPENIRRLFTVTLEFIHKNHSDNFKKYNGDSSPFDSTQPLLQRCLKAQKQDRKTSVLPLYFLLSLLMLGIGYWSYTNHQEQQVKQHAELLELTLAEQKQQQWQQVLTHLGAEPGLIVINTNQKQNKIDVLLDPLARPPNEVLNLITTKNIKFQTRPYLSIDKEILLLRAEKILQKPPKVQLFVDNSILIISGKAPLPWSDNLHRNWQKIIGINQINTHDLQVFDPNVRRLTTLQTEIQKSKVFFATNNIQLDQESETSIKKVSQLLSQLITLANQSHKSVQISIIANSDNIGTEAINNKLTQQRADVVESKLIDYGVSSNVFRSVASYAESQKSERSVSYQVSLIDKIRDI